MAHSVPMTASAKSRSAVAQAGRFIDSRKPCHSIVGIRNTSHATAKIATSEVDHGSEMAIRTTAMSAAFVHAAVLRQTEGDT